MKFPLRPFAMFTAGALCISVCCPAFAGHPSTTFPIQAHADVSSAASRAAEDTVVIPGPLRSFLRMAGISQEIMPADVLPLLARNVDLRGFENSGETEFLSLVNRYVQLAREIRVMAGPSGTIHIAGCSEAMALVRVLGYQFEGQCGEKDAFLITASPERAFLTSDSGFPLTSLEDALQRHRTFTYSFPSTPVPVMFRARDWLALSTYRKKNKGDLLDAMLHDQNLDRLYWAMSRIDVETRVSLRHSPGLKTLLPLASALDFYGSQLSIRSGRVQVPGGPGAERAWQELVEANPKSSGEFVDHLLTRDHGWLAAYYDAIARVNREQQVHLTEAARLKFVYRVYRAAGKESSATRGVFQDNAELMILFSRLRWQANGEPYVPGNLALWREILDRQSTPKLIRGWVRHARTWDTTEELLATLAACSDFESSTGPLQTYLTLSEIDSRRSPQDRLAAGTVRLMADHFGEFHSWYLLFSEFPTLSDTSIANFLNAAQSVNGIPGQTLRANALGAFQANIGLWEILARQQQIPVNELNSSWQEMMRHFSGISSSARLFDAARASLESTVVAAGGKANDSQARIIDLLAGPAQTDPVGQQVHEELAERMRSVLDDQRLVSLDTLFALYDGLDQMAHGQQDRDRLIQLAGALRDFEMPRAIFTASEKVQWAPEIYTSRHAELQVRTDLTRVIRGPASPGQLEAARGQLTPFLRDTLVGLNYAYYEPPGAQVLHHNPLFVRSHDFSGASIVGASQIWGPPNLIGIGITAGGGAYLIGSLSDLPYALATTEQDFIAPENVQALIWREAVPALVVDAVEPRWWNVTPTELHAAALYQRYGEQLLVSASGNAGLRARVEELLADRMTPRRLEVAEQALQSPQDAEAFVPRLLPSESFYLAAAFREKYPAEAGAWGPAGRELDDLEKTQPSEVSLKRLSRDFGVPHPALEQNYACDILDVKPFPALGGDPSRLFGESWQSSNLYWARLADEKGYPPVMLNLLVPELTRHMIAKIFATDIEDWPALQRAMQQTGEEFLQGRIGVPGTMTVAERQRGMALGR